MSRGRSTMPIVVLLSLAIVASAAVGAPASAQGDEDDVVTREIGSPEPSPAASSVATSVGQPFVLAVAHAAVFEDGLTVTFERVVEDSRCPTTVQCVWEGNAEVALEVVMPGESAASLRLNTNPSFPTEASYHTYTVTLLGLEPYPRLVSGPENSYRSSSIIRA